MRKVTETEYATAETFLAEYASRHVQRLQQAPCDVVNMHSTNKELFELERDMPAKFSAYAPWGDQNKNAVTTWTGEVIARVTHEGNWHRNNFGAKWRQLTIRTDWNQTYTGREYDSRQIVNFRRIA